jgi:hypothetical protein
MSSDQFSLAMHLAHTTIDALNLVSFIGDWNSGEWSLIQSWHDFDLALSFDQTLDQGIEVARSEAQRVGVESHFEVALCGLLAPVISETFRIGLAVLCGTWAVQIARGSPVICNAPAPFMDEDSWIAWCLRGNEWPVMANPVGEELLPEEKQEQLLAHALRQQHSIAVGQG